MHVGHITATTVLQFHLTHILVLTFSYGLINNLQLLNGSLTIAGIFEIQTVCTDGDCGEINVASVMTMEAVRWYLQTVNDNDSQPFKIGLSVYKTCGNLGSAGDAAVDVISRYRRYNTTDASKDLIIGLIGPEYSSETQVVSSILGSQTTSDRLLQIGFSATSTELSDRDKYPNYYRVVVADDVQITAVLQLMVELRWNRIALIYVNDTYGRIGAQMLHKNVAEYHICVSKMDAIEIDSNRQIEASKIREILNSYVIEVPRIEGVVYVGDNAIVKKVLQIFDSMSMSDVPIFILLESSLGTDVFYSATGSLLSKTKGTLALSMPYYDLTEFKQYWESLFTDKTALLNASITNPYLKDVFRAYSSCDFSSAGCDALTEKEISEKSFQPVDVHYAVFATHVLTEALKKFYSTVCNRECDTINQFKARFKPDHLVEAMDGLSVTFGGIHASFTRDSPNIHLADGEKEYEVYNFQQDPIDENKFTFVNVGYPSSKNLVLEANKTKDYGPDGSEENYLRRGQCPVGQRCSECIDSDISAMNYHIPGDFYVIGLVSINNQAIPGPLGCGTVRKRHGYQMYLSLQFALNEFKTRSWYKIYKDLFAGKDIGLIVINSCNNALEVVPKILELHSKGLRLPNGTYMDLKHRILGYVGGQAADVSEPAASQLTKLKIVQISYTSTNSILSNKDLYPYFLRIVSPDNVQARAMMEIVKDLGGEYIQLVFSEGAYGEGSRNAVLAAASEGKICVTQTIEVKESDAYHEYYEMLRRKPHAKIVLILLRSHVVGPFLHDVDLSMERGDFQFIGSEAWGKNTEVLKYDITQGAIITAMEMDNERDLDDFIKRQRPEYNVSNPWLEDYIQSRQDCYFKWSYDKTFNRECTDDIMPLSHPDFESDPWCIFVTNTMFALLKGAAIFYSNQCGSSTSVQLCANFVKNPDDFLRVLRNVKMDIYGTGEILIFDENGDGLMGYKIYNIQAGQEDKTTRGYKLVGSYSPNGGLKFENKNIEYPTDDPIVSACPSKLACKACLGDVSTSDKSDKVQSAVVIVLGALVGVLAVVTIALGVVFLLKWRRKRKIPNDAYITPMCMSERPSAEGGHSENDTAYVIANPSLDHD